MEKMIEELIAPCGMNCGICSGYLASKYDVRSKGIKMPYCIGCRPRDKKCAFLKKRCDLLLQGKVQYCYECDDFPCLRLQHIDKRYRSNFKMSMIENLEFIKEKGVTIFLEQEVDKWKCPECGAEICCHNGICFNCGLDKLESKKKRLEKAGFVERVKLYCGDAASLPFDDDTFDVVFMSFTLELFDTPEIPKVLEQIKRVLKPGGRLGVASMSKENGKSIFLRLYEWIHNKWPKYVDCRPIYVEQSLSEVGYEIKSKEMVGLFRLPGEIVVAINIHSRNID